jgi:cytidylate kinase
MNEAQHAMTEMQAITISREYGSGGGEIAARLARRLAWRLVDHEIITQVAQELEIPEAEAAAYDEYVEGRIARILNSIRPILESSALPTPTAYSLPSSAVGTSSSTSLSSPTAGARRFYDTLRHVVLAAANAGHVVIVGRGGQVLLANRRDVLHVRVVAPLEQRVTYVVRREGLDEAAARARIQTKDHARNRYMQNQFHCNHEDPHLYDQVLNTGLLDLDSAVDLICLALERKASRLHVPTEELGPAAGMPRYAGQPADFPGRPRSS